MSDDAGPISPWASDDIPVVPSAVVWDPPPDGTAPVDEAGQLSPAPNRDPRRSRRNAALGAIAVVAALVVGFLAWPQGPQGAVSDSRRDASDAAPTTLDTLPMTPDSDSDSDSDTVLDSAAESSNSGQDNSNEVDNLELPPAVAAISMPTELIARSVDGRIHTISLPSGRLTTVDLGLDHNGLPFGGGSLVASPSAVVITTSGADPIIVPRSGVPIAVDLDEFGDGVDQITPYGWVADESGAARFVVSAYRSTTDSEQSFLVADDGSVIAQTNTALSSFVFPSAALGVLIVNDAGGAYRLDVDGTAEKIADGTVIASSRSQFLIRECDDARLCQTLIRNLDGTDDRIVDLPDSLGRNFFGLSLSPDGTAVSYGRYGRSPSRVIVDFDGNEFETDTSGGFVRVGAWAADGSGEFGPGGENDGIAFLDRASGATFVFATELGQIGSVAARYPASELVDTPVTAAPIGFSPEAPVAQIGLDLVTVGRLGGAAHLDLDEATATPWESPSLRGNEPPQLFSAETTVLAVAADGDAAFVAQFGGVTVLDADAIPPSPLLPGRLDGTVWARPPGAELDVESRLFEFNGSQLSNGTAVTVDRATLLGGDSLGGLVIETGGDVYVTAGGDPGGFTTGLNRLTSGELLAMGPGHALVRECDTVRNCTTSRLDRATRELTAIVGSPVVAAEAVTSEREISLIGSMSPDGDVVLTQLDVVVPDGTQPVQVWTLHDLASNTQTVLKTPAQGQPIIWNDDSSYAAFASGDALFIYERSTASIITVDSPVGASAVIAVDENFSADTAPN